MNSEPNKSSELAAKLALAFNSSPERVVQERVLDKTTGEPSDRFPRFVEHLIPKTMEEIAESFATVPYISANGLLDERPLTFMEILDKLYELGFKVEKEEN